MDIKPKIEDLEGERPPVTNLGTIDLTFDEDDEDTPPNPTSRPHQPAVAPSPAFATPVASNSPLLHNSEARASSTSALGLAADSVGSLQPVGGNPVAGSGTLADRIKKLRRKRADEDEGPQVALDQVSTPSSLPATSIPTTLETDAPVKKRGKKGKK